MEHRGEIIENAIRQSGIPLTRLVKKLKKSRGWMYAVFSNPKVSIDVVLEIGKVIHYDFSEEIKELKKYKNLSYENHARDPKLNYSKELKEVEQWKNKYMELLERYNELLVKAGKPKAYKTIVNKRKNKGE